MAWYYYLDNQLRFPFEARCIVAKVVSPLSKGETVHVFRMAPEDACSADMLLLIAGKVEPSRSPSPNWRQSTWINQPPMPSAPGAIG